MSTIVRARVAHTPRNPFAVDGALEVFEDGGLAFADGRILDCGPFRDVQAGHPEAGILDARDTILLPGFVDCHVHFPQIRVIGAMGLELLDWLREQRKFVGIESLKLRMHADLRDARELAGISATREIAGATRI